MLDPPVGKPKLLYLVTEDWYFCSHRLPIATAARDAGFEVVVATRVQNHAEEIRSRGFRTIPIRLRRKETRPWREMGSVLELVRLYRREKPDLVHHVAMKPVLYGSLAARLSSVPCVVNALAGLGYVFASNESRAGAMRPFIRMALARALSVSNSNVVVQNPDDARILVQAGVPGKSIRVIRGSGVDLAQFAPRAEPPGDIVVTLVSRLLWDKGVGELVEAARILKRQRANVRVVLVGAPDPENPASIREDHLRSWLREGVIEWEGARDDIPHVWARSHIGVLPSYREGLPKTLLEAAACGRSIVATDVAGCREIVRDGENGFLVPPRQPRSLANAILRLAEDKDLRKRMGATGRQLVEAQFSEPHVVAETLNLYRNALGPRWPT